MTEPTAHRVTWFVPDRPVEGNTVYVRPAPDQPERRHAVIVSKTVDQLRDERDALLAELDGCTDLHCTHHWAQHEQLDETRWLLGEEDR